MFDSWRSWFLFRKDVFIFLRRISQLFVSFSLCCNFNLVGLTFWRFRTNIRDFLFGRLPWFFQHLHNSTFFFTALFFTAQQQKAYSLFEKLLLETVTYLTVWLAKSLQQTLLMPFRRECTIHSLSNFSESNRLLPRFLSVYLSTHVVCQNID